MATIATQSTSVSATKLETELTDMDAGVLKDIPAKSLLTINGTPMTPAQIDTQVKGYLGPIAAAEAAKQQYQTALVARGNMLVEARAFYLQLKKAVIAYFGNQSAQLADFGLTPAKAKTAKTSVQKAVIAAKASLTRKARGTTSKKQKQQINPGVGVPAVAIGADGVATTIPPTVVDGAIPGSTSTSPQTGAGSSTTASAPAAGSTTAGSGAGGSNA
jgi:hypothetical protein